MPDECLAVEDVQFRYPAAPQLLSGVSLLVPSGGHVSTLLGPSGSGKTTLLAIAMGVLRPDSGNVRRLGRFLPVFQEFDQMLLPWFSARRNIRWGRNDDFGEDLSIVARILEMEPWLETQPLKLSGGQRQRVALARALFGKPGLLLLDEPLASVDIGTHWRLLPSIRRFLKDMRISALWVTHNLGEAFEVSDSILVLDRKGGIVPFQRGHEGFESQAKGHIERLLR